jgi:hypothetical protein
LIFITSLKPFFSHENRWSSNQTKRFLHSVPYTLDGKSHAKSINEQWKRTIILSVAEPFPFVYCRQPICNKFTRELCPIEVAIDDIEDRLVSMKQEMNGIAVLNNLMRLVQGSVLPQVFKILNIHV